MRFSLLLVFCLKPFPFTLIFDVLLCEVVIL